MKRKYKGLVYNGGQGARKTERARRAAEAAVRLQVLHQRQ